jgi:iron complex outermembrane receptor protein
MAHELINGFLIRGRAALLAASIIGTMATAQTPATTTTQARSSSDELLPDIVVTAQRRKESAQSVPIAVSAFSADLMSQRGIASPLQLIQYVPNLFGSNNVGLGSANAYYIRGLGNTETVATFDPPVGTYVDDIYMSRQNGNNFAFFDIDRIEVLRGPQGTLFGRNTTGGAVDVIMKRPSDTLGGYAEGTYGAYGKKMLRGSIDLPLNKTIQLKLSGYYQNDNGYVINSTTKERNNDSDLGGIRAAVQFKFTDQVTWNVAGSYMRNDGENIINYDCDPNNPANCNGRFASTGLLNKYPAGTTSPFVALGVTGRKANYSLGNNVDTQLYTSNLEWAGDNFTVNLITGFIDLKQQYLLDFADGRGLPNVADPIPIPHGYPTGGYDILNDGSHRQFTQEIKVNGNLFDGKIDYVTGFFYFHEKNRTDFADVLNLGPIFGIPGNVGFPAILADRTLDNTADAKAGYLQADFKATDTLKLTAGIRYTDEKKTISIFDNRASCQPSNPSCLNTINLSVALPTGTVAIPTTQRTNIWTPRFAINYKPNDDMLFFASATKGFKSGGWNARGSAPNTLLPFDPEKVWSYEMGAKTEFFDRRVRINLTAFWLETKDLQTPSAFIDPVSGAATFITQNFANYQNKGLELEFSAVPVRGLTVYANLGYQNDKYKVSDTLSPNKYGVKAVRQQQLDCLAQLAAHKIPLGPTGSDNAPDCAAGIIDSNGNIATPMRTPDFSIAFGGSYDYPIPAAGIILTPSVNALYRSSLETGTANGTIYSGNITAPSGAVYPANPFGGDFIAGSLTKSYWQVGAALTMRTDDNNWTLSLECENCFDKAFVQSSLVNFNYLSPPRTWQVRAKRVF